MALFYADASALVKLVLDEPESSVLRTYIDGADLISCELVLSEIPRAIRRAAATDPALPRERLFARAGELLDAIGLLAVGHEGVESTGADRSSDVDRVERAQARLGERAGGDQKLTVEWPLRSPRMNSVSHYATSTPVTVWSSSGGFKDT